MKKYKDDYEIISTIDNKGREKQTLAYRGSYFSINMDDEDLRRVKKGSLVLLSVILLFHISNGFIHNQGMFQFYVSLPYVFSYLAIGYSVSGTLHLPTKHGLYRRDEIELSISRAKTASQFLMLLLFISEFGELLFLLSGSLTISRLHDYLYLALNTGAMAALYVLIRLQKGVKVEAKPED